MVACFLLACGIMGYVKANEETPACVESQFCCCIRWRWLKCRKIPTFMTVVQNLKEVSGSGLRLNGEVTARPKRCQPCPKAEQKARNSQTKQ